jgi:hypothetical protein
MISSFTKLGPYEIGTLGNRRSGLRMLTVVVPESRASRTLVLRITLLTSNHFRGQKRTFQQ